MKHLYDLFRQRTTELGVATEKIIQSFSQFGAATKKALPPVVQAVEQSEWHRYTTRQGLVYERNIVTGKTRPL